MPTLRKHLRSDLEKVIVKARDVAEKAATTALEGLAVDQGKAFPHMNPAACALRKRLRARGRAVGDARATNGSQTIDHLAQLVGYEHWHRMLFARFLAENGLLLEPEHQVALSLDDVEELAREEGVELWELAGGYAQRMLPGVFRNDDAALEVTLAREDRAKLEKHLAALDPAVFTADDSLGWTYQFWQTKRKKEVNDSGVKIGADELSPVTQLFTEDYMVEFLLHNTLGAWWARKFGPIQAASEEEARAQAALPERDGIGITWTYLRFFQDEETQTWKPAAGTFEGWPDAAKDITFLDPCMGSGHFPVFALPILARLRMEEENLSAAEAVHAVLRDNIHGLELDPRCCQIGAFNLALTAWKLAGHQPLPALHIACCGLAPQAKLADWVALAGEEKRLQFGMKALYELFDQAPVLGSLINPRTVAGAGFSFDFHELQPLLEQAMAREAKDDSAHEMAVTARGLAKAAEMLTKEFTLLATNVPYLSNRKQCHELKLFSTSRYGQAKNSLAATFLLRLIEASAKGSSIALVVAQNWLFAPSYSELRKNLITTLKWDMLAKLGSGAFETITGEVVTVAAGIWTRSPPDLLDCLSMINAARFRSIKDKAGHLRAGTVEIQEQARQLLNPDCRILVGTASQERALDEVAIAPQGVKTGDDPRWRICMWEVPVLGHSWIPYLSTVKKHTPYGGRYLLLDWRTNGEGMIRPRVNNLAVGRVGVAISQTGDLPSTLYLGERFNSNVAPIVPENVELVPALWAYCSSDQYNAEVRLIDESLKVTNVPLIQVPFDRDYWQEVADEKYPDGLPKPQSDDPTQWLFNGHPMGSEQLLQVAVARLLGYRWPRQTGSSFPDCPTLDPDGLEIFADEDGIVCLTPLRGEAKAAERLRKLLDAGFAGEGWNERQHLAATSSTKAKLEDWLRDEFFQQHCKLFHHRPFIWHLWDGRPDGFHALVNYHQLAAPNGDGHKLLEILTYSYLGDWIRRQQDDADNGVPGAEERVVAAEFLQQELKHILAGEPPYDVFVRWKPLHQQAIGWYPDLNDGVRLNIRPFMLAADVKPTRGKDKGSGVLRWKPKNIKWGKDQGNEPEREKQDFPWFWSWDEKAEDFAGGNKFDGNRWNDLHYKTATKQAAREAHQQEEGVS